MITIDLPSVLWGGAGTVLVFLLGWGVKHLLDRLVLPRFLDWWATTTRSRSLRRARRLTTQFEDEMACYSDVRMLVCKTDARLRRTLFQVSIIMLTCFAFVLRPERITLLLDYTNPIKNFAYLGNSISILIRIAVGVVLLVNLFVLWFIWATPTLNEQMIRTPEIPAARTLKRVNKLLVSAGLSDVDQINWLATHAQHLLKLANLVPS